MDEIVKQAMAKWPNVPDCYGWLALDARGTWRMRDERAQALGQAGSPIRHPALLDFIERNRAVDPHGRHYFQNGPQRVYIDLAGAPFIAHLTPAGQIGLNDGSVVPVIDAAWLSDAGRLFIRAGNRIALLDDREWARAADALRHASPTGAAPEWDRLQAWMAGSDTELYWRCGTQTVRLQHVQDAHVSTFFGFVAAPRAPA